MIVKSRDGTGRGQAVAILEQKLDPSTLAIVRAALDDSDRLAVIRDAFLEGSDARAVQMIRDLDPVGIRKALGVNSGVQIISQGTAQINAHPQLPFRATHLIVSPRCAAYFNIDGIRVGNYSQYVNSDPSSRTAVAHSLGSTTSPSVNENVARQCACDPVGYVRSSPSTSPGVEIQRSTSPRSVA